MGDLLILGDSVQWGQGLLPGHKYGRLVFHELRRQDPALIEHMLAHSGAIIGAGATVSSARTDGEVPVGYPTIFEQLAAFPGDPQEVTAVLLNGGINDIDIRTILNPFVALSTLEALTIEHCYDSMRQLLVETVARFPRTTTRIVVTPYFPILSSRSTPFRIPRVLIIHGLQPGPPAMTTAGAFFKAIVERCLLFWRESTRCLQRAVDESNQGLAVPRIVLVDPGFSEANAVFADDPWLWGLKEDFSPQDEVTGARRGACDIALPPHDLLGREQCYRASAGHPNVIGARKYADAIIAALTE